ncbi:YibE/F family protein [Zongyangia hominis]|uniref:YibE/F family protein n=1 Tax=Zongyangia hominis TaxID=2763677 RepID=A0A926IBM8_9FIRM|nr:YibE/F family protein [Zongyangia hominis]MBC8570347.1 YibE/F family protein [Zongyangia hominis]
MKLTSKKRIALYWLVILLSAAFLLLGYHWAASRGDGESNALPQGDDLYRSKITEIVAEDLVETDLGGQKVYQWICYFRVRLTEGPYKGETALVRQSVDENMIPASIPAKVGDEIYVSLSEGEDGAFGGEDTLTGFVGDYVRTTPLYLLVGAFLLLLLLFGRKKGVNTIISLTFTCLAVFVVLIPAILGGHSPVFAAVLVCVYIIVMTLLIVNGFTFKTAASALGCAGGVLMAGVIAYSMEYILKLTGMIEEKSLLLTTITGNSGFDFRGLIFAGIIIGALGAVMDVAMDIASALEELIFKVPTLTFRQIVASGMKVGRDVMGTMANTLILAYAGGSLTTILLITTSGKSLSLILNGELIAVEILKAMAGSIGILFTIPITAIITALLQTEQVHFLRRKSHSGAGALPPGVDGQSEQEAVRESAAEKAAVWTAEDAPARPVSMEAADAPFPSSPPAAEKVGVVAASEAAGDSVSGDAGEASKEGMADQWAHFQEIMGEKRE